MASTSASEPTLQVPGPETLDFYLQQALLSSSQTSDPASLFSLPSSPSPSPIPLSPSGPNNLILYPGSFNPPHAGHLATILYFYEHRHDFDITCLFLFADPETVVGGRGKKYSVFVMGQEFRYKLFASHPSLQPLIQTGFLKIITGSMTSHIAFLRHTTDLINSSSSSSSITTPNSLNHNSSDSSAIRFRATLIGFLGGDKLSMHSAPHEKPGELIEWGPVDEFLIMNARRPVDFYSPPPSLPPLSTTEQKSRELEAQDRSEVDINPELESQPRPPATNPPSNLRSCTPWQQHPPDPHNHTLSRDQRIGHLWICKALTIPGQPIIRFRASEGGSKSNGISSTKIRKIMCEVADGELLGQLRDLVVCSERLVEWLVGEREKMRLGMGMRIGVGKESEGEEKEGKGEGESASESEGTKAFL